MGDVRCQPLSAASRRGPCLESDVSLRVSGQCEGAIPGYDDDRWLLDHDAMRWLRLELRCENDELAIIDATALEFALKA